ncbi:hypothetical protein OEZ86_009449 [Tetradesmus obliquus]|nr:hypothetical protein OEZ86_009449 [Tetradesmus obliquus]
MSLYGDLPSAKDDDAGDVKPIKGWVASAQKLQPSWKKPGSVLAPPSVTRGGRGPAGGRTPTAAGRGGGRGPPPASLPAAANIVNIHASPAGQQHHHQQQQRGSAFSFFTAANGQALQDEYDPAKPNDFEELIKQRQRQQREAEEEAERLARLREVQQEIERRKQEQAEAAAFIAAAARPPPGSENQLNQQQQQPIKPEDEDADAEFAYQGPMGGLGSSSSNAAAAAAAAAGLGSSSNAASGDAAAADDDEYEQERQRRLKMSGDDAFRARGRLGGAGPPASSSSSGSFGGLPGLSGPPAAAAAAAAAPPFMQQQQQPGKGMGLAQKLLEKMGWREGQGLGRHRQGMATPLVAQKTAANAGVIVNAAGGQPGQSGDRPRGGSAFVGVPGRAVVLRNMVGPGEVDEDLEEEVGTELTKYGTVTDVMIFEVTTPGWPAEEAVRIFAQFDRTEAATRALVDLQGRFFGGRQVRAAFFSEERFEKQQLAPQPGEFGEGSSTA